MQGNLKTLDITADIELMKIIQKVVKENEYKNIVNVPPTNEKTKYKTNL